MVRWTPYRPTAAGGFARIGLAGLLMLPLGCGSDKGSPEDGAAEQSAATVSAPAENTPPEPEAPSPAVAKTPAAAEPVAPGRPAAPALPTLFGDEAESPAAMAGDDAEPAGGEEFVVSVPDFDEPEAVPDVAADAPPGEVFDALFIAFRSGDGDAWERLQTQLVEGGDASAEALVQRLSDGDESRRELAAMLLPILTPSVDTHREALTAALASPTPVVRANAAVLLSQDLETAETVIPVLVELLGRDDADLQTLAATALGNYGPDAEAALAPLKRLQAKTGNPMVREAVDNAVEQIEL